MSSDPIISKVLTGGVSLVAPAQSDQSGPQVSPVLHMSVAFL